MSRLTLKPALSLAALALCGISAAGQIVLLPFEVETRRRISGDGRFVLSDESRYEARTQRNVTLPRANSVYSEYQELTYNGQVQFGDRAGFEYAYTFRRDSGGLSETDHMLIEADRNGVNRLQHGYYGEGTSVSAWNHEFLTGTGKSLSGDGKVAFIYRQGGGVFCTYAERVNGVVVETPMTDAFYGQPIVIDSNYNGYIAVGSQGTGSLASRQGFYWTRANGFVSLNQFFPAATSVKPLSITDDGTLVSLDVDGVASVYSTENGSGTLEGFLQTKGINTTDWTFEKAFFSANGEAVTGIGTYKGVPAGFHVWFGGNHLTVDIEREHVLPGGAVKGTVSVTQTKPYGRSVLLTSSSPNLTVDANAWIPANQRVGTFTVRTNAAANGDRYTLNASCDGLTASDDLGAIARMTKLEVLSNDFFDLHPVTLRGHLDRVTNVPVAFKLTWSGLAGGSHKTMNFGVGSSTRDLPFTPESQYGVAAATNVTFTITDTRAPFTVSRTASATMHQLLSTHTLDTAGMTSNQTATATLQLTFPAPAGGFSYGLKTNNAANVTIPPSVSIPPGGVSATYQVQTGTITAAKNTSVTASPTIETRKSKTFWVNVTP